MAPKLFESSASAPFWVYTTFRDEAVIGTLISELHHRRMIAVRPCRFQNALPVDWIK